MPSEFRHFESSGGVSQVLKNDHLPPTSTFKSRDPFPPFATHKKPVASRFRPKSAPVKTPWRDLGISSIDPFQKRRRFNVTLNQHSIETKLSKQAPYASRKYESPSPISLALQGYPRLNTAGKMEVHPEYNSMADPHLVDYYAKKFGFILPNQTMTVRRPATAAARLAKSKQKKDKLMKGNVIYKVTIRTGDKKNAGTTAKVYLKMRGSKNKMNKKQLKKKYPDGEERLFKFEKGTTASFKIRGPELGELERITLEHDGLEKKHSWFVEEIEITNSVTKRNWLFPCHRWLSLHEGDCQLSRELKPSEGTKVGGKTEYEVIVITGDKRGAGTDANVSVTIYGSRGNTPKLMLKNSKNNFERGATDIFVVKSAVVGVLKKIRIEHDNTGFGPGWNLDRVVITDLSNVKRKCYFPCGQWFSKDEGDKLICRDLVGTTDPNEIRKPNKYVLTTVTGDRRGAGTDANVFITLFGEAGDSGEKALMKSGNNFERGKKDEFTIECPSLGTLNRVRIGHDNRGVSAGWFLDKVIVDDVNQGRVYDFLCGMWFAKDEADGRIQRDLYKDGKLGGAPQGIPYKITVQTGDVTNAGTSARVFVILYGDVKRKVEGKTAVVEDNSGKVYFENGKFSRGRTDIFNVDIAAALSPCTRVTIGHDNSGAGPGWYCDKVIVHCPTTGIEQYFICDKWLALHEGDNLIERDLYERMSMRKTLKAKGIWYAKFHTSDKRMAGTNANVNICLYGDKGHSDDIVLDNKSDNFEAGSVDEFKVEIEEIGKPYKIRVWHDSDGNFSGWHLDKLELQNLSTKDKYLFRCNRWLAADEDDFSTTREMAAEGSGIKKPLSIIKYLVEVYTGDKRGAGTDANVFLNIFGEQGDTGPRKLRKSSENINKHERNTGGKAYQDGAALNKFEAGKTEKFYIEAVNLMKLNKVRVWHDGKWAGAGWFLDKIVVQEGLDTKSRITFPCFKWLAKDEEDGQITRELVPEGESLLLATTTYYISVMTGDVSKAGTDANVFIKIFGQDGDTGILWLKSSENKLGNKFERGRTDTFRVEATDIGEIEKIRIGHDGANIGSGWFLDKVEVDVKSRGELYVFSNHRWLDTGEEDGRIELDLHPTEVKQKKPRIPYEVTAKTGDKLGAGTDARVFIQIYGKDCKSDIHWLRNRTDNFEQNSTDTFKLEDIDVGSIQKIRIGHDDKGGSSGWFLDKIKVQRLPPKKKKLKETKDSKETRRKSRLYADQTSQDIDDDGKTAKLLHHFACNRWLATDEDDGEIVRELVPTDADGRPYKRDPYNVYRVKMCTGDVSGAGTDATINVCLYGDKGDTGTRKLWRSKDHINKFERGGEDEFIIEAVDLGVLERIQVLNANNGAGSAWFLDRVQINEDVRGTNVVFPCQRWLATNEDDGQLMRTLVPIDNALIEHAKQINVGKAHNYFRKYLGLEIMAQLNTYHIYVCTGKESNAGTDANVYIELYGEMDTSGRCYLKSTRNNRNKYEKGATDEFVIESAGLGSLQKIVIGHDNSGIGPGWFLESVLVDCPSVGVSKIFQCGRWLAKDMDDGALERTLFPLESATKHYNKFVPYEILTQTADSMSAGTDANVYVTVFGKEVATAETFLAPRKDDRKSLFKRNAEDSFLLEMDDVGDTVEKLRIGHSDTSMGAGWKLGKVQLRKIKDSGPNKKGISSSEIYQFQCNRWLARDEDDRAIVRELIPSEVVERSIDKFGRVSDHKIERNMLEKRKYKVHVFTGNKSGSGTDANVFFTLVGDLGDSGERKLVKSETHMDKFEKNHEDIFTMEAVDLGKLYMAQIRHDNSNLSPSWFLDRVEVIDDQNDKTVFHCERWLAKNKDDGKLERQLYAKGYNGDTSSLSTARSYGGSVRSLKSVRDYGRDSPRRPNKAFDGPTIPYTIRVYTGDKPDCDTDANVFINLVGTQERQSGRIDLDLQTGKKKFAKGSIEVFSIDAPDVGDVRAIEIGHDGVKSSQGWFLNDVEVDIPTAGKNYTFPCKRWLAINQDDGLITRRISVEDAQMKKYRALVPYEMVIRTGDIEGAGTDAGISVQFFGVQGTSETIVLDKRADRFERAKLDTLKIELEDIAPLRMMRVTLDGKGSRPDWYLEDITLTNLKTKEPTLFRCRDKFSKKEKSLMKEMAAIVKGKTLIDNTNYEIHVKTSDVSGAGTDANVSLVLFGENGESKELKLKDSTTHRNKFERNHTDAFLFKEMLSLGELQKIRIWHDDAGFGAAWHLNSVEVMDSMGNQTYRFHCDKWLASGKGDKQVVRDITCEGRASASNLERLVYEITVATSDKRDASTSHNAFIILEGEGRKSKEFLIENSSMKKMLKRGQEDVFKFQSANIGRLKGVYIGHLEREDGPTVKATNHENMWHCYDVKVHNTGTGEKCTILVNTYLQLSSSRKDARYFEVTKVQEGRTQSIRQSAAIRYKILVSTGTVKGAGTDANVFITIFGTNGSSGKQKLDKSFKNLFETGDVDDFILEFVDLGDVQKVRIEHDNSGIGAAWFLDKVQVVNLTSNRTWNFPCNKWFDKSKGDRLISRDLLALDD